MDDIYAMGSAAYLETVSALATEEVIWDRAPREAFARRILNRSDWPEFLRGWVDAEDDAREDGSPGVDFYVPPALERESEPESILDRDAFDEIGEQPAVTDHQTEVVCAARDEFRRWLGFRGRPRRNAIVSAFRGCQLPGKRPTDYDAFRNVWIAEARGFGLTEPARPEEFWA